MPSRSRHGTWGSSLKSFAREPGAIRLAVALCAVGASEAVGQVPPDAMSFSFRDSIMTLELGTEPARREVIVQGTNLPRQAGGDLRVLDVGGQGPPRLTVDFGTPEPLGATPGGSGRSWRVPLSVTGLPPGSRVRRTASVGLTEDTTILLVDFVLDNTVSALSWNVRGPVADLVLGRDSLGRRTSFTVSSGDARVTGLRIVQSTLQDPSTKKQLEAGHLRLIPDSSTIPPHATERIALAVRPEFFGPGTFSGSVVLAVYGTADTKAFDISVHSSSRCRKFWGFFAILAGVVIMWLLTVVLKNRLFHREAKRLMGLLEASLASFKEPMDRATSHFNEGLSKLGTERARASEALGPEAVNLPHWLEGVPEARVQALNQHLQGVAKQVTILDEIVDRGVREVLRRAKITEEELAKLSAQGQIVPDPRDRFVKALKALDDLAYLTDLATVRGGVDKALDDLGGSLASVTSFTKPPSKAERAEDVPVALVHGLAWLAFFAITVTVGYMTLVWPNPGFGTLKDIALCLLWGVGLPTGGEQLRQITPAHVASRLTIHLPGDK